MWLCLMDVGQRQRRSKALCTVSVSSWHALLSVRLAVGGKEGRDTPGKGFLDRG
jgi:hypothetical protein